MEVLRHTLISDGPSDANLIPVINWTLKEVGGVELVEGVHAELWRLPSKPGSLAERIIKAVELFPCRILFVHRDAEKESPVNRQQEISTAVKAAENQGFHLPAAAIIPVRMLEAWLLFDEQAIRQAAGNPNGIVPLDLPALGRVEDRPDPKGDLREALRTASELRGRRLKKFNTAQAQRRVMDFIQDFSPLKRLAAFRSFQKSVEQMSANGYSPGFYGGES